MVEKNDISKIRDELKSIEYSKEGEFPKKVVFMGECIASKEPMILETILGSCISTCLFDPETKIGGMNHFLMPGAFMDFNLEEMIEKKDCKYGIFAIERLIQKMIELGAKKENIRAKVFGASYLGAIGKKTIINIQEKNISFVNSYLKMAKIPIVSSYLGKENALKIMFWTHTGETLIKNIKTHGTGEEELYQVDLKK